MMFAVERNHMCRVQMASVKESNLLDSAHFVKSTHRLMKRDKTRGGLGTREMYVVNSDIITSVRSVSYSRITLLTLVVNEKHGFLTAKTDNNVVETAEDTSQHMTW